MKQPKKGLEPSTYALRMRRATNCATLAYLLYYYQILVYYTHSILILQAFFSIHQQFIKMTLDNLWKVLLGATAPNCTFI